MLEFCPKCHTQAYDDTSFFCYRCGAQLVNSAPQKKIDVSQNFRIDISDKISRIESDKSRIFSKGSLIHMVKPIEVCAQCGVPINNMNGIFCKNCGVYIRESQSGEVSSILQQSVSGSLIKTTGIYQHPEITATKERVAASIEVISSPGPDVSSNTNANERRSLFILAGIAILFFILMLAFLLIFP
jgi:hypothetical protein